MEEHRIELHQIKDGNWKVIEKKIYFKCASCGLKRNVKIEPPKIIIESRECLQCGSNEVMVPARISMGKHSWSDVLMFGAMLGFPPAIAYIKEEVKIALT